MSNRFDLSHIEGDNTPIDVLELQPLLQELLEDEGITRISDLVQEFRKENPFVDVPRIRSKRSAAIKGLLNEYAAKVANPRSFVRFILHRSRVFQYFAIPALVAFVMWITPHADFNKDEICTILIVVLGLFCFDCGVWARVPLGTRTPFNTGRIHIITVFLAVGVARLTLTDSYGSTEWFRLITIGITLGLWEAVRTIVRYKYVDADEFISKVDLQARHGMIERLDKWWSKLSGPSQVAFITGFFTAISTTIGGALTLISSIAKNS